MKTYKELLSQLAEPHRKKALANLAPWNAEKKAVSVSDAILEAFEWKTSPEGGNYWDDVWFETLSCEK